MADVRSMLRDERAARAPPSRLKKDAHHAQTNKKRKADDSPEDVRKKTKAEQIRNLPTNFFDDGALESAPDVDEATLPGFVAAKEPDPLIEALEVDTTPALQAVAIENGSVPSNFFENHRGVPALDVEWAAFERDLASRPSQPQQTALEAIKNNAVISAAPLSAAEVAAQARQEQSDRRDGRAEELAAEKEEAARTLEEEFEEMDALEERAKRLREKREQLRAAQIVPASDVEVVPPLTQSGEQRASCGSDEDEDEDEADEWDGWRFGTS